MRDGTHLEGVHHTSKKDILLFVTCTVNIDTIKLRCPCSAYTFGGRFKRSYKPIFGYEPNERGLGYIPLALRESGISSSIFALA